MASLPSLGFVEADELVVREVFARIDAQAGLPSVIETVERWRPDVLLRESAELASLAAAERAGVPHVHVCIGMHEVATRFADVIGGPLEELGRLAGLGDGRLPAALADETVFSAVPDVLDHAAGDVPPEAEAFLRFHEITPATDSHDLPDWGNPDAPLVYVTFGSVTGSLPHLTGVYREAVDVLADVEARVLITVGRKLEPAGLGPLPSNVHATQWWPQAAVLAQAAAMLGHGGFGTTMGALACRRSPGRRAAVHLRPDRQRRARRGRGSRDRHREGRRQAGRRAGLPVARGCDVRRVRSPRRCGDARRCRRLRRPCPCSPAWSADERKHARDHRGSTPAGCPASPRWRSPGVGGLPRVTETRGRPVSRALVSSPCNAGWKPTSPVVVHISSAVGYAVVGAFQFSSTLRRRHPGWHRQPGAGRYCAGGARPMSRWTRSSGAVAHPQLLVERHRARPSTAWMTRAYALAVGAGTQVFTQGFGEALLGTQEGTRDLLLGSAWVINLAVAEYILRRPARGRRHSGQVVGSAGGRSSTGGSRDTRSDGSQV